MFSSDRLKVSSVATKELGERVADFLRRQHPVKTAQNVSADIGLPVSTVSKWLEGAATPSFYAGFKLADAYGPDFIASVWPHHVGFLGVAARAEQRRRVKAEIAALEAKLERSA